MDGCFFLRVVNLCLPYYGTQKYHVVHCCISVIDSVVAKILQFFVTTLYEMLNI